MVKKKTKRASRKPKLLNKDLAKAIAQALSPPPELAAFLTTASKSLEQMNKQMADMDAQLGKLVIHVAGAQAASVLVEPAPTPSTKPLNG
jgi:hypothetical protein